MPNVPPVTVTITSTYGPGLTATAQSFTRVTGLAFDYVKNTIKIDHADGRLTAYYDYSAIATVTYTISGGTATITIST